MTCRQPELPAHRPLSGELHPRPLSPNNGDRGRGWSWKMWQVGGEQEVGVVARRRRGKADAEQEQVRWWDLEGRVDDLRGGHE